LAANTFLLLFFCSLQIEKKFDGWCSDKGNIIFIEATFLFEEVTFDFYCSFAIFIYFTTIAIVSAFC